MHVVPTPHQGNFSLEQMKTNTKSHNQSRCSLVQPSPNGHIYNLSSGNMVEEGSGRLEKTELRGIYHEMVVSPRNVRSCTQNT